MSPARSQIDGYSSARTFVPAPHQVGPDSGDDDDFCDSCNCSRAKLQFLFSFFKKKTLRWTLQFP
jgi:hypothetical protein